MKTERERELDQLHREVIRKHKQIRNGGGQKIILNDYSTPEVQKEILRLKELVEAETAQVESAKSKD